MELCRAYPIGEYPCKTRSAAAIMHMIMNNLDPRVAQFPHELVTYGGNGQVFSNWAQVLFDLFFHLVAPETSFTHFYANSLSYARALKAMNDD